MNELAIGASPAKRSFLCGILVGGALLVSTLHARTAEASGYLTARFGADHGTPSTPNTFAIYFNPAALGGTTGTTITGDASVLLRFARYNRTDQALSPSQESSKSDPQYRSANTGTANLTNVLAVPFVGVNTDFGTKNLRGGFAVYIPFGGIANWSRRNGTPGVPGTQDGVQRWHNISGQILAVYNTFALAYKIRPARLTIGASVSPIIHHVATVRARNSDGSDDTLNSGGRLVEGRSLLDATGVNIGASFGLYWEPSEDLQFGLSYISQPGFGQTRMSGTLKTQLGATSQSEDKIDFLQTYPDVIRFGATGRVTNRLDVRGDFEFVRWSVFNRQCVVNKGDNCDVADDARDLSDGRVKLNVPRNWNNAIGLRVGPGYHVNDRLEVFGSAGITTPAVPKSTIDASTIDAFRVYLTAGVKFELSKHFAVAASYNHIFFATVTTNGQNNQSLRDRPSPLYNVSRSPSADGVYKSQIGFVNTNVAYTF